MSFKDLWSRTLADLPKEVATVPILVIALRAQMRNTWNTALDHAAAQLEKAEEPDKDCLLRCVGRVRKEKVQDDA